MTGELQHTTLHACSPKTVPGDDDAKLAAELNKCRKRTRKLIRAYKAVSPLEKEKAAQALHDYFGSHAVKVVAAYEAHTHRFPNRPVPLKKVFQVAAAFNWNSPILERVALFHIPKGSGGYRLVCDFGRIWRAAAYGLKPLLKIQLGRNKRPFQFFFKGYRKAVRAAKGHLSSGHLYICHLDIVNCYPSFEVAKFGK